MRPIRWSPTARSRLCAILRANLSSSPRLKRYFEAPRLHAVRLARCRPIRPLARSFAPVKDGATNRRTRHETISAIRPCSATASSNAHAHCASGNARRANHRCRSTTARRVGVRHAGTAAAPGGRRPGCARQSHRRRSEKGEKRHVRIVRCGLFGQRDLASDDQRGLREELMALRRLPCWRKCAICGHSNRYCLGWLGARDVQHDNIHLARGGRLASREQRFL
jgi:hypothetical protein